MSAPEEQYDEFAVRPEDRGDAWEPPPRNLKTLAKPSVNGHTTNGTGNSAEPTEPKETFPFPPVILSPDLKAIEGEEAD